MVVIIDKRKKGSTEGSYDRSKAMSVIQKWRICLEVKYYMLRKLKIPYLLSLDCFQLFFSIDSSLKYY